MSLEMQRKARSASAATQRTVTLGGGGRVGGIAAVASRARWMSLALQRSAIAHGSDWASVKSRPPRASPPCTQRRRRDE